MRKMNRKTIIETVTGGDTITGGVFKALKKLAPDAEYLKEDESLDLVYYYAHSGNKIISPLVSLNMKGDRLTDAETTSIAHAIITICKTNWDKLYNAMTVDYSPIENVDGYITETTTSKGSKSNTSSLTDSGTDSHKYGGSDTRTNSGTDTTANTGTSTDENSIKDGKTESVSQTYGFNETDAVNDGKNTTTVNQTITDTTTNDLTATRTLDTSEKTEYNNTDDETLSITHSGSGSENSDGSVSHELHRHGNIGVTTNQQMINEEIELRKKFFTEMLFRDVDKYMTIPIY